LTIALAIFVLAAIAFHGGTDTGADCTGGHGFAAELRRRNDEQHQSDTQ
jgi:hypothetical protein